MRRVANIVFGVSLLAAVLSAWFAPRLISWYYTPPVELGVTCKPAVEWGIAVYRKTVLAGAGAGFLVGLGVAWLFRSFGRTAEPSASA